MPSFFTVNYSLGSSMLACKGKTYADQRQTLKNRTEMREAQREMARFNHNRQ